MPRFSRESINTTYFHVMTQGIDKKYIFNEPAEIKFYIKIMYELLKEHNVKIIAYCIMNNSQILIKTLDVINNNKLEILNIDVNESKLAITLKNVIENSVLEQLHNELIK